MAISLSELISRVRQRADQENSQFVSDEEITHFINDEIEDIYAQMVNIDDGALFGTPSPILVKVGDNAYQLPNDFLRLVDVNVYTGNRWVAACAADPQNYYALLSDTYVGDYDVRYFLHRNVDQGRYELFMFPAKDVNDIGVRYLKEAPALSLSTDTLKWPSNWHAGVVLGAAVKCLIKEESDPTGLIFERDRVVARTLKDIRAQKVSEIKTLRESGRRLRTNRFRLPRIY